MGSQLEEAFAEGAILSCPARPLGAVSSLETLRVGYFIRNLSDSDSTTHLAILHFISTSSMCDSFAQTDVFILLGI